MTQKNFGKKVKGPTQGPKTPKYPKFQPCARRLKICMRAAEDIRTTACYLHLGKMLRGPDLAPQRRYHLHHVFQHYEMVISRSGHCHLPHVFRFNITRCSVRIITLPSPQCIFDLTLRDGKAEISALPSPPCKIKNTWGRY